MLHPGHAEDTLFLAAEEDWRIYEEDCAIPQTCSDTIEHVPYQHTSQAPMRGSVAQETAREITEQILDVGALSSAEIAALPAFERSVMLSHTRSAAPGEPEFVVWHGKKEIRNGGVMQNLSCWT